MINSFKTVGLNTYEVIKNDIICGILPPLKKLKLSDLKIKYNTSVSTLREILSRLSGDGFVVSKEQKGFYVSAVSKSDLIEIANLRILIESHALEQSIKKSNPEWEGLLVSAHHKLKFYENEMLKNETDDRNNWKKYDSDFHQALVKNCGSINLIELHKLVFDKYLRYQLLILSFRGPKSIEEHQKILDFTLNKNYEKAQSVLKKHIINGINHAVKNFKWD
ncbi:MAG: GntR family transcriptional regulator [Alphaproteobacteria bacterium]|nr:GntR family transcriptional regulator [Alphaproteobacteria bacterium]